MDVSRVPPTAGPQIGTAMEARRRPRRGRSVAVGLCVAGVVAAAWGGYAVGRRTSVSPTPPQSEDASVEQWWGDHHGAVDALRASIRDSQRALERQDAAALGPACLTMHDDAAITLKSALPAPDGELTAELEGAIEDAHDAAHMCLAAAAGSQNNYGGEFRSQMAESERQLKEATELMGGRPAAA